MSNVNPFAANAAPAAPAAAPAETVAAPMAAATAPAAPAAEEIAVEKKKRKKDPNYRTMTDQDAKYVIDNYATKTPKEIAAELKVASHQVSQIGYKTRKAMNDAKAELEKLPDSPEKAAKMAKINEILAKVPAREKGAGAGGVKRTDTVDAYISSLL
jgi:hypothetical protein